MLASLLLPAMASAATAGGAWSVVAKGVAKTSLGLAAMNATTLFLAGGGGALSRGPFVAASTDGGVHWALVPGAPASEFALSNDVTVTASGLRVSAGVSFVRGPVAFSARGPDAGAAFAAAVTEDVFATQSVESAHGRVFLTSEWNHWENGTACALPASPQCSGVLVADESTFPHAAFDHVVWGGTDEPGVDARYGSFPSATTWYVAGGSWPSGRAAAHAARLARAGKPPLAAERRVNRRSGPLDGYRAIITKTTDGWKTWRAVFNDTGFNETFAFYFNQIACADEDTCWAAAECPATECVDAGGLYGAFIYHTRDGGATWERQLFAYEVSLLKLVVVSKTRVIAVGGEVGISFHGVVAATDDGGATWSQTKLRGAGGYAFGIDVLKDGSTGYAITCSMGGVGGCGVWRYSP